PVLAQQPVSSRASVKNMNPNIQTVFLPNRSPLISMRIQFLIGAVDDPKGKEGLANLTAAMIAQGGSKKLSYDEITAQFYPLATNFGAQVDKEMTTFVGATHVDNLDKYFSIIRQMLLEPGFREEDFSRLKLDQINYLKTSLRQGNDEELGKERLYNLIYAGYPYEHPNAGLISALEKITLQDVKDFYAKKYTHTKLVLGLSGNFSKKFEQELLTAFETLPTTAKVMAASIPTQEKDPNAGTKIDIIQRETRATAISLGFPIDVNRSSKDFPALALVASYLGQHRSSNSYLYQRLREARGLNYGDYAYIEYFPRGMFQFDPDPNLARHSQIFQIWIRPVEPNNAHFALRAALYEFDKLTKNGMSQETFDETREFLSKYVNILTQTQDSALGYELDSKFYGIGNFNVYMKDQLAKLTVTDVNRAIKAHLANQPMRIVMVTKDAESLKNSLVANAASPIKYNSEKPKEILDEDKIIENYKITLQPTDVTITPVEKVFQ
ncbi:MAG: pitrilysin family protein, partial [Pyrinomonadaceae bacterium]